MKQLPTLRSVEVTQYIQPLKEGGSLPGLVAADDGFKYVIKFKGAGQGYKALVAELIGGLIAQQLGLKLPELVYAQLDESFGRTEPDQEIQDLLKASEGENIALHFLSGALTFDAVVNKVDDLLAAKILWLDAYIFNVDRTAKNTNMLMWNKELWLIDHGASLYFHHAWDNWESYISKPFLQISNHVLKAQSAQIEVVDTLFKSILNKEIITHIVNQVPSTWLITEGDSMTVTEKRNAYIQLLTERLNLSANFVNAIKNAK